MKLKAKNDTVITRSLHLPYKPFETTFAHICLFLEPAGLLDSCAHNTIKYNAMQCNAVQYNTIQYNTAQQNTEYNPINNTTQHRIQSNTIHYAIYFLGNLSSPGLKTVLKIERYAQRLTQGYMGDGGSQGGIQDKVHEQGDSAP